MSIPIQLLEKIEIAENSKERVEAFDKIASLFLGKNNEESLSWYKKSYYESILSDYSVPFCQDYFFQFLILSFLSSPFQH